MMSATRCSNAARSKAPSAAIDARALVVGKQLLPFLVGDLVRGSGTHSLPPIVVFRRGNPGTVEAGPVMAHGVLGPEVVPAGADLTDAIHGESLVVEGDALGQH